MSFQFGLDNLLADESRLSQLSGRNVGLVGHPGSVTRTLDHALDALVARGCNIVRAFGPQHGMRGDKQDNMIESEDFLDPTHQIPVVSLYGAHRRPTPEMLEGLDVILFDLQDVGCRIYTYISTLHYFLEACSGTDIEVWVLDRPNPAGRPVDGLYLEDGEQSFVGCDLLPTRHGLTVGELGEWMKTTNGFDVQYSNILMTGYKPEQPGQWGWPTDCPWVNPSPNAASVNMTRCFGGTVLLEGTELSEGRGTTIPLEVIGAPSLPLDDMLNILERAAPDWLAGITPRHCFFEPTFHKHKGVLCQGIHFMTGGPNYQHDAFKPYRLIAGFLKALRELRPDMQIWRYHHYEYEPNRIPIDVINGGPALREWVEDPGQDFDDFERRVSADVKDWQEKRQPFLQY